MALVKFGAGIVGMAGSIAGTTFARNRYGSYARARTKPTNYQSPLRSKIRSIMGQARDIWYDVLDDAGRAAWETYAANVPMKNRLGETQTFTGYNMFVRTVTAMMYHDLDPITAAPGLFSLAEQDDTLTVQGLADTQEISVGYNLDLPWAAEDGAYMLVYQGIAKDVTCNYFKGPWRKVGVIMADPGKMVTPVEFDAAYPIAVGQKIFAQARIVRADARLSELFRASGEVVGTPLTNPSAAGDYGDTTLETVLTFPQNMNVAVKPSAGAFKYTGGAVTGLPHSTITWTNATTLTLTAETLASPVGTGVLKYKPGVIPLITALGEVYGRFEQEEIVSA